MLDLHVCELHGCLLPMEAKKVYQIPWKGNYRWLHTTIWVLGIGFGSSTRASASTTEPSLQPHMTRFVIERECDHGNPAGTG